MNKLNLFSVFSIFAWLVVLIYVTTIHAKGEEKVEIEPVKMVVMEAENENPVFNQPAQEPVYYEDWFRENANIIPDCEITHYCTEKYKHICGTGDGLTSTGVPVTAGWTCAVDPSVIPYGSEIMVDYGDRVEFYKAQDCGAWIKGNHIDLAVGTHEEALELGIKSATVYWMEVEREFN